VKARFDHLRRFFSGWRVVSIGPAEIARYLEERRTHEAENETINRELTVLGRMLRLAYENGKGGPTFEADQNDQPVRVPASWWPVPTRSAAS
jgi:hypothetical protein